jgi:hypothetical protein
LVFRVKIHKARPLPIVLERINVELPNRKRGIYFYVVKT